MHLVGYLYEEPFGFLTLEESINRISGNVGKKLPLLVA
jgi:hypothetical protein